MYLYMIVRIMTHGDLPISPLYVVFLITALGCDSCDVHSITLLTPGNTFSRPRRIQYRSVQSNCMRTHKRLQLATVQALILDIVVLHLSLFELQIRQIQKNTVPTYTSMPSYYSHHWILQLTSTNPPPATKQEKTKGLDPCM